MKREYFVAAVFCRHVLLTYIYFNKTCLQKLLPIYIYIYFFLSLSLYIYIYIYIQTERESEESAREGKRQRKSIYSVTRSCRDRRRSILYSGFSYIWDWSNLYTLTQALIWDQRKSLLYLGFFYSGYTVFKHFFRYILLRITDKLSLSLLLISFCFQI